MYTDETRIKAKREIIAKVRKGEIAERQKRSIRPDCTSCLVCLIALSPFRAFAMILSLSLRLYPCFIRVHPWLLPFSVALRGSPCLRGSPTRRIGERRPVARPLRDIAVAAVAFPQTGHGF